MGNCLGGPKMAIKDRWTLIRGGRKYRLTVFGRNVSLVTLYQDCSSHHDWKKRQPEDGAYFP